MAAERSQQQMIYHLLLNQIKMGNYQNGERFPTVKEIADHFNVSYCPAQIALKALENDGYVRLSKGRTAEVIWQPNDDIVETSSFEGRMEVLEDLYESLCYLLPLFILQGLSLMEKEQLNKLKERLAEDQEALSFILYDSFERTLRPMRNQMLMYLFNDIDAFVGTAMLDRVKYLYKGQENAALEKIKEYFMNAVECVQKQDCKNAFAQFSLLCGHIKSFFTIDSELSQPSASVSPVEAFAWEPQKGRKRYCDDIAMDLVCKINQGVYLVGDYLPKGPVLADTYHVSAITMRRTIAILNELGVVKNINGVGTKVTFPGDRSILYKLKDMTLDRNLIQFLEALQILAITGESVAFNAFSFFNETAFTDIKRALKLKGDERSKIRTFAACLQAIVHCTPFKTISEVYSKLTLMTLKGSVLRLESTGDEHIMWWPEMSLQFENSLNQKDAALFSKTFSDLLCRSFFSTKETLCEIGIEQATSVASPIAFSNIELAVK